MFGFVFVVVVVETPQHPSPEEDYGQTGWNDMFVSKKAFCSVFEMKIWIFSIIKKTIFLVRQGDRVRTAIHFYDFDAPPFIPRLNLKPLVMLLILDEADG